MKSSAQESLPSHADPSAATIHLPMPEAGMFDVPEVRATIVDFRNLRAVVFGSALIIGGSLMMTTTIGVAAITGMLWRGDTPETILAELPDSQIFAFFIATGGLLMGVAGGYTAATISGHRHIRFAIWTGVVATLLELVLQAFLSDSGPAWLTAIGFCMIVPMAMLGGWLAKPSASAPIAEIIRR